VRSGEHAGGRGGEASLGRRELLPRRGGELGHNHRRDRVAAGAEIIANDPFGAISSCCAPASRQWAPESVVIVNWRELYRRFGGVAVLPPRQPHIPKT
jgi:hypothetical protein